MLYQNPSEYVLTAHSELVRVNTIYCTSWMNSSKGEVNLKWKYLPSLIMWGLLLKKGKCTRGELFFFLKSTYSYFWRCLILLRQFSVYKSCLPLQNGSKISEVYPHSFLFNIYHSLGKFSRWHIKFFFLLSLQFMQIVSLGCFVCLGCEPFDG